MVATGGSGESADTFDEFYRAQFGNLLTQIRAAVGDLEVAQDLVQEAFCRAWSHWARLSAYDDPTGWVRRVAWNLAISNNRRRRTMRQFVLRQRIEHVAGPQPDRVALTKALSALPMAHRRAVALFYLADMSTADIAAECHVPDATVRSWLHRARTALLRQLSAQQAGGSHATDRR